MTTEDELKRPWPTREYRTLSWISLLLLVPTLILSLFFLIRLVVNSVSRWTEWGGSEWAAAGAWVGGLMTFGAVSVAVWQTNNANGQARRAEAQAKVSRAEDEKRHDVAIDAANKRLTDELDAQRRHVQLLAVLHVASALDEFTTASADLLKIYKYLTEPFDSGDRADALAAFSEWKPLYDSASRSFVEPNLMVDDVETRQALGELQGLCRDVQTVIKGVNAGISEGYSGMPMNTAFAAGQVDDITKLRVQMIGMARRNIAMVPALADKDEASAEDSN